jgi:hypothetical protein
MVNVEVGIILFLLSMSFSILPHCSVYIVVHHHPPFNQFSHLCVVLRFPIRLGNDINWRLDLMLYEPWAAKLIAGQGSHGKMQSCCPLDSGGAVREVERISGHWCPLRGEKREITVLKGKECEVGNLSAYNSSINSSKVQMQSGHWCTKVENPDQTRLCHSIHTSSSEP